MMTIFGFEKVDYISKRSKQRVEGLNLHCVSDYVENDRMTGQQVERIFISVRSPAWSSVQASKIGDMVKVLYNRFGSVDDVIVQKPDQKAASGK